VADHDERRRSMDALASASAVLSTAAGGVRTFGYHWCWQCRDQLTGLARADRCGCGDWIQPRYREE
jgi:hypothetical protein